VKTFFRYWILIFGMFLVTDVWAQPQIRARVDAQQIAIGDQFHLFLEVSLNNDDGKIQWPTSLEFEGLEVVDKGRLDSLIDGKSIIYKQKIQLTGFDSGIYAIPPITFLVLKPDGNTQQYFSDSFLIFVNAVPVDLQAPFKAEKDIEMVAPAWWYHWPKYLMALGIAASLVGLYWFLRKFRKVKKSKPQSVELPFEKSLRRLNQIHHQEYVGEQGEKEYYTLLTDILRDYIEEQFRLNIAELTTDELLQVLKKDKRLSAIRKEMKLIFQTADLAKFAKAQPGFQMQNQIWDSAYSVIQKTKMMPQEGSAA
jgi:hypothetical protein